MSLKQYFNVRTRKGLTIMSWTICIPLCILLEIFLSQISITWELVAFISATFLIALTVLITIFARYADSEKFPISAYINIGITYFYSLSSIGLLGVDLAFTLYNKENGLVKDQESHRLLMAVFWNIIQWGGILHGTVLNKFYQKYWTSGHFTVGKKIKQSIKKLVILIVAMVIILILFGILVYSVWGMHGFDGIKGAILAMGNVYSMLTLVLLLGYGLFNVPVFLWKYADKKHTLYQELEIAHETRKNYRDAQIEFYTIVSKCKNLAQKKRNKDNTEYMDLLLAELPKQDLEGMNIVHSKHMEFEFKPGQEITEDQIAQIRYEFKLAYFLYKRKKARWLTLFNRVDKLVEKPVVFNPEILQRKAFSNDQENSDSISQDQLILQPSESSSRKLLVYRSLSVLAFLLCLLMLVTEATVIYDYRYTLPYYVIENHGDYTEVIILFTLGFLSSLTLVCYFTIFNLKLSDYLQLVPRHTDCITFQSITGFCSKIITVLCFNYMTILGEVKPDMEDQEFKTSYTQFYSSMIKVPFFGTKYNTIMPIFILIFGCIFALLSLLKLKNRALQAIQKISEEKNEKDDKDDKNKKKKDQAAMTLVQKILQGEKAVLNEYDLVKKKEERNRLLRFNQVEKYNDLELQQLDDEELMNNVYQKQTKAVEKSGKIKVDQSQDHDLEEELLSEKKGMFSKQNQYLGDKSGKQDKKLNQSAAQLLNKKLESDKSSFNSIQKSESSSDEEIEDTKQLTQKQVGQQPKQNNFQGMFKKQRLDIDNSVSEDLNAFKKQQKDESDDDISNNKFNPSSKSSSKMSSRKSSDQSNLSRNEEKKYPSKFKKKNQKKNSQIDPDELKKEGFLFKKSSKQFFGISKWQKRYVVLEGNQLIFYEDEKKREAKKKVDIKKVYYVCSHYDEDAPIKSKKLSKSEVDESRFDIYTPNRIFMLKTDGNSLWESEGWIRSLQESGEYHNLDYGNIQKLNLKQ